MLRERLRLDELSRALAYLASAVFLLTLSGANGFDLVIGWSFGIVSLFFIIAIIIQKLQRLANQMHEFLILPLFFITIARLDIVVINTHRIEFIVLGVIFPLSVITVWVLGMWKDTKIFKERLKQRVAKGWVGIAYLGVLVIYLGLVITALVLAEIKKYGTSNWYLFGALVCLIILTAINWKEIQKK
jgi:hypothetical protein